MQRLRRSAILDGEKAGSVASASLSSLGTALMRLADGGSEGAVTFRDSQSKSAVWLPGRGGNGLSPQCERDGRPLDSHLADP